MNAGAIFFFFRIFAATRLGLKWELGRTGDKTGDTEGIWDTVG